MYVVNVRIRVDNCFTKNRLQVSILAYVFVLFVAQTRFEVVNVMYMLIAVE